MNVRTIMTAAVLAVLCTGCRSDGGIDRSDGPKGLAFSWKCVANQTRADAATTQHAVADAPDALRRSVVQSRKDMTESYYLYLQNGEHR